MNVGLIAHDSKKKLMQNFCIAYKGILSKHNLYATGTTGKLIEEVTNLNIHKFLPGHLQNSFANKSDHSSSSQIPLFLGIGVPNPNIWFLHADACCHVTIKTALQFSLIFIP